MSFWLKKGSLEPLELFPDRKDPPQTLNAKPFSPLFSGSASWSPSALHTRAASTPDGTRSNWMYSVNSMKLVGGLLAVGEMEG